MFWNYFKVRKYYMYFQLKPKSNLRLHISFLGMKVHQTN